MAAIPKIVITGGPCGGKTRGMARLIKKLSDRGYLVFVVPEIPTLLFNVGLEPKEMMAEELFEFEKAVIGIQLYFEKVIEATVAKISPGAKKIILCDRGVMDHKVYFPERYSFDDLLGKEYGLSNADILSRYLCVIHLLTTANDKTEVYERHKRNNPARTESSVEAIEIDKKTRQCWLNHPCFVLVDNSTGFSGNMDRALAAICDFLEN